jgi:hypothetical protein
MDAATTLVPKVHPLTREMEADDPLELTGQPAPGDPEVMLTCIVQEFAGVGWDREQLLSLFHDPDYPVLNQLLKLFGEDEIDRRLRAIVGDVGVFRVRESIAEDLDFDEPQLIELTVRSDPRR